MFSSSNSVKVAGIAAAVAGKWDSLKDISNENVDFIADFTKKTGVEGRFSASPRQTTSDFCFAAAKELIEYNSIEKDKIGVLVFVSQTADYALPATACVLQHRLGLGENLIAFDVNLGCSGYVYGLNIVSSLMQTTGVKYGILLAGDTSARELRVNQCSKTSHAAALLFGDSGTATLLERAEDMSLEYALNTDGNGYNAIIAPYGLWRNPDKPEDLKNGTNMDDIGVFNFSTNKVPEQIKMYMERTNTSPKDYDCLVLHQANLMIMKRITKKSGFSPEKMLVSLNKFGNTSSASIPITLVNTYGERGEAGNINALCSGFGVGLSWGTVAIKIDISDILPLIHTDEYFRDGYNVNDKKKN